MKLFISLLCILIGTFSNAYAGQSSSEQTTYIMRVSAEKPDEQSNFMLSYVTASYDGQISHYQITKSTPYETKLTTNQLDVLLTSLTSNQNIHLSISSVTKDGEKSLSSAQGHGIVAEENNNNSRIIAF